MAKIHHMVGLVATIACSQGVLIFRCNQLPIISHISVFKPKPVRRRLAAVKKHVEQLGNDQQDEGFVRHPFLVKEDEKIPGRTCFNGLYNYSE